MGFRQNTALAASDEAENDRQYVKALARGLKVLHAFRPEDRALGNAELARRTGFPKPTVSRLTFTLLSMGYLSLDEDTGRYSLHPHVLSLGYPILRRLSVRETARPMMQELANSCRGAVALGVRDGLEMIVIEQARHSTMTTVPLDIGAFREIALTALGRAYIAALKERERGVLLDQIRAADEQQWPAVKAAIEANLLHYAERGYCYSVGDWRPNYNAVGVPLVLGDGMVVAFNCGGMANRVTEALMPELGQALVNLVQKLTQIHG